MKRIYDSFNANFKEEETKKIQSACSKLTKVLAETRHSNRDTEILSEIIKKLNWIINQQYKEV